MKLNGVQHFSLSPCAQDKMSVMAFVRLLNGAFGESESYGLSMCVMLWHFTMLFMCHVY